MTLTESRNNALRGASPLQHPWVWSRGSCVLEAGLPHGGVGQCRPLGERPMSLDATRQIVDLFVGVESGGVLVMRMPRGRDARRQPCPRATGPSPRAGAPAGTQPPAAAEA